MNIPHKEMLHQAKYPSSLSHFLGLHHMAHGAAQSQERSEDQGESSRYSNTSLSEVNNGKSFTIAAILGLKAEQDRLMPIADLSAVMNLSVHADNGESNRHMACGRLSHNTGNQPPSSAGGALNSVAGHLTNHFPTHRPLQRSQDSSVKKSSSKSKRVRTIFTPEQLERLEAEFERQQYMVGPERLYLAHTLQLTEAQVKVWFQNRRIKWRKHHLELTQQRLALIRQRQLTHQLQASEGEAGVCSDSMDTNSATEDA